MIRPATEQDIPAILAIFNVNIKTSTGIYMYEEQTLAQRLDWFHSKKKKGEPLFVYEIEGEVAGYATYGSFRPYPANLYTVEHSVYVHEKHQRKGIASKLMQVLIEHATQEGIKTMVGGIDARNEGSIAIHEKLGFTHSGTIRNAGYKFDQWLDLAFYQIDLPGPFKNNDDKCNA